ncbi:MAG: carboxypeptidase regulatory-like domain-containing protein, partial [bacterium]
AVTLALFLLLVFLLVVYLGDDSAPKEGVTTAKISVSEGEVVVSQNDRAKTLRDGDELIVDAAGLGMNPTPSSQIASLTASKPTDQDIISTTSDIRDHNAQQTEFWVIGYVTTEDGKAIAESRVSADEIEQTDSVYTDERGYYVLSLAAPGDYTLRSIPPGAYLGASASVSLTEEATTVIKNITHSIAPLAIRGKVVNRETSTPIQGAEIRAWSPKYPEQRSIKATSGPDGEFALRCAGKGIFQLCVSAKGYIPYNPSLSLSSDDPLVNIQVDEQTKENEYIVKLTPGFTVIVRVFDDNARPIENAEVSIYLSEEQVRTPKGETDGKGECVFDTLPKVSAAAGVRKESYGEALSNTFEPGTTDNPTLVDITLRKPGSLSGRVIDQYGDPVAGRNIFAHYDQVRERSAGVIGTAPSMQNTTDADGGYSWNRFGEGLYTIGVMSENGMSFETEKKVVMKAGEKRTGFDIVIERGDESIRGLVVDENREPIADASVFIMQLFRENQTISQNFEEFTSNEKGEFYVSNLKECDRLIIEVKSEGYSPYKYNGDMRSTIVATLKRSGSIQGAVLDKVTRQPVPEASVQLTGSNANSGEEPKATTNENGVFLFDDVAFGYYLLVTEANGYARTHGPRLTVQPGELAKDLLIELNPGNTFAGILVDTNGNPVPGATIALSSNTDRKYRNLMGVPVAIVPPEEAVSASDGAFQLSNLPSQGDTLLISQKGFTPTQFVVTPDFLNGPPVRITIAAGGTIEGRVLDSDEKPVTGIGIVTSNYPENLYSYETTTDEKGEYRFEHLPAHPFLVIKFGKQMGADMDYKRVTVEEGKVVRADFGDGAVIQGTLYRGDTPAPGQQIKLIQADMLSKEFQLTTYSSDSWSGKGTYRFTGVPAGEYMILFTTDPKKPSLHFYNTEGMQPVTVRQSQKEYQIDLYAQTYQIAGIVSERENGKPISGAEVKLLKSQEGIGSIQLVQEAKTDDQGAFALYPPAPGTFRAVASKEGFDSGSVDVSISPKSEAGVTVPRVAADIALTPVDTSIKVLLSLEGQPWSAPKMRFQIWRDGFINEIPYKSLPDQEGVHLLEGLEPRVMTLIINADTNSRFFRAYSQPIRLSKGQTAVLSLQLCEIMRYMVRLLPSDGAEILGPVQVNIGGIPPTAQTPEYIGSPNSFMMEVPFGNHSVRIKVPGYKPIQCIPEEIAIPGRWPNRAELLLELEKE